MADILVDLIVVAIFGMLLIKAKLVKGKGIFNDEYMSLETSGIIKGAMAILVISHHMAQETDCGRVFSLLRPIGFTAVAVFFFYSGYGLMKKYKSDPSYKNNFFAKRISAVLIPYAVINVVYWVMYAAMGNMYSFKEFIHTFAVGDPMASYSWYVVFILGFYIIFGIFMHIFKDKHKLMIGAMAVTYVGWAMLCKYVIHFDPCWYKTAHMPIVGMIWALYEDKIIALIRKKYWLSFFLCGGVTAVIEGLTIFYPAESGFVSYIIRAANAFFFTITIMVVLQKVKLGSPVFKFLGKISYEFYILQGVAIELFKSNLINIKNDVVWIVAVFVVTTLLAYVFNLLFSRINKSVRKAIDKR